MPRFKIATSERVLFVGKTGSGKTFLAERLSLPLEHFVVIDPNDALAGRFRAETITNESWQQFLSGEPGRYRIVPPVENTREYYETVFQGLYERGNVVVYLDEVYAIVPPGTKPPAYFSALYTRGRHRNIGTWAATQRPTWVPLFVISEAEWWFVFRLQLKTDRQRMASVLGPMVERMVRHPHGFFYYHVSWDSPRYTKGIKG